MPDDVQVIYADGILDVLNLGPNVSITYFVFGRDPETGQIKRYPCLRIVRPKTSLLKSDGMIATMAAAQPDPFRRTDLHS